MTSFFSAGFERWALNHKPVFCNKASKEKRRKHDRCIMRKRCATLFQSIPADRFLANSSFSYLIIPFVALFPYSLILSQISAARKTSLAPHRKESSRFFANFCRQRLPPERRMRGAFADAARRVNSHLVTITRVSPVILATGVEHRNEIILPAFDAGGTVERLSIAGYFRTKSQLCGRQTPSLGGNLAENRRFPARRVNTNLSVLMTTSFLF